MSVLWDGLRRVARAASVLAFGVALGGCAIEPGDEGEEVRDSYVSFEEFEAATYQEPDTGIYIVDGDWPIRGREALRQFYEAHVVGEGALSVYNQGSDFAWNAVDRLSLTYCVSTTFGARYETVRKAMNAAGAAWAQAANVRFIHLTDQDSSCDATNTRVAFDVRPTSSQPYVARAFFPNSVRADRNVLIDNQAFGNLGAWTLTGVMKHELGHGIGFRHEHIRTAQQSANCAETSSGRRDLTSYDGNSVMHYPQCNGTNAADLVLTQRDRDGAAALYGRRHGGAANLAYGKAASQSSTYAAWAPAANAADGNIDGDYSHGSVTHTANEASPWWQVDLGSVQSVGEVVLYNRSDCCSERLNNFNLLVSKDGVSWRTLPHPGQAGPRAMFAVNQAARYVKVQLNNTGVVRPLSLAEVEVLAARNLAIGKAASQSSVVFGGAASRAVDGNQSGNYGGSSVTHTDVELTPWWQVDLGAVQPVGEVVLYNRTDCCADRLSNFKVMASANGAAWTQINHAGIAGQRTAFGVNQAARFVKVQLNSTGAGRHLSLAEVEVMAARNLALGKVATQSSTHIYLSAPLAASSAVDGSTLGVTEYIAHTSDEASPWWQVDLGRVQPVGEVVLYNRSDCCAARLNNFELRASEDGVSWAVYPYAGTAGAVTSMVVNRPARFVKVQLNNTGTARPLQLAEVEVLAARNLALSGSPSQSSNYFGTSLASYAVDGNTDGNYSNGSVTHTDHEASPWWQVDLGSAMPVNEVLLYNRTDCCGARLTSFKVMLSEDGATWRNMPFPGTAGARESFLSRQLARYVKVQLDNNGDNDPLQLAEAEVYLWQ